MSRTEGLPVFRYHRDPIRTGFVVRSEAVCVCCESARGFVYKGPIRGQIVGLEERLCPWCLADGSAASKFDATFVSAYSLESLPRVILDEVTRRTPGFFSWQEEEWPVCCGDASVYVATVGREGLIRAFPEWVDVLKRNLVEVWKYTQEDVVGVLENLNLDHGGPSVYLFQCSHCEARHVSWDVL